MDAILGILSLIVVPAVSLWFVNYAGEHTFLAFAFPLLSICIAGIYDSFGRFGNANNNNTKLIIRIVLDFSAEAFVVMDILPQLPDYRYVPPALLLISGLCVLGDAVYMLYWAIYVSKFHAGRTF